MNKGFTLLEIVLYLAFLSLVIVTAIPLFLDVNMWRSEEVAMSSVTNEFLFIEARIRNLINTSTAILTPAPGEFSDTLVFDTENRGRFTLALEDQLVLRSHEEQTTDSLTATNTVVTNVSFYQPAQAEPRKILFNIAINRFNLGTTTYLFRNE